MSNAKKFVIPAILSIIAIGILYYIQIPALNIQSKDFWWFLIWVVVILVIFFGIPRMHEKGVHIGDKVQGFADGFSGKMGNMRERAEKRAAGKQTQEVDVDEVDGKKVKKKRKKGGLLKKITFKNPISIAITAVVIFLIVIFVGTLISSPLFFSRGYAELIQSEQGDFAQDISEISMNNVPVVDRDTAVRLGSRTIGEMSDLVSQYAIDETYNAYTQISYKDAPYRVSSLVYADIIKWITNTMQGLPGYVTVNMVTQETQLVRLQEGNYMHISTGEHFNNYLYRHARFHYPTEIFGEAAFEIDDDGVPYWIVPTVQYRLALFGGKDYNGAILVNACTGECQRYNIEDIPTWCDKIFNADMVYSQLEYYGKYKGGFINAYIGQSGVQVPTGSKSPSILGTSSSDSESSSSTSTSGYNYLAIDNDVYMYTGMTSANSDESLVGFVLVNLRTKDTRYYTCSGATESSAMSSAEGQVQQMKYKATSPLLLNIADRPTYFLSLKDDAGLVKMYAYIDVQQYQIVGTGSTVADAQKNYVMALASSSDVKVDSAKLSGVADKDSFVEATITDIQSVVIEGNTYYYICLKDKATIYTCPVTINASLPFLKAGNNIKISISVEKDGVAEISTLEVL